MALATKPSANVSVTIAASTNSGLTPNQSQLSFTPSNWDQAQTVSVSADHDDDASPGSARLTHTASGGDYGSVAAELPVAVTDDDTPAIVLSETALPVPEDGSVTYTVALATLPTQKVTLNLTGTADTDLTVTPGTVEFEPNAWDTPVTVTVEAAADLDTDNDPETLTYTASGGDYEGVTASLGVEVVDTVAASIVLNKTRLQVKEAGAAVAYRVSLGLQPASDVTVQVTLVNSAPLFVRHLLRIGPERDTDFHPGQLGSVTEDRRFRGQGRRDGARGAPAAPPGFGAAGTARRRSSTCRCWSRRRRHREATCYRSPRCRWPRMGPPATR